MYPHKIENQNIKTKKAFTLVELIIVITILVILATIAFVSFSQYTENSRDTNRVVSLQNLQKGLDVYFIKSSSYPLPDNSITITSSGVEYSIQGEIGASVTSAIGSSLALDPKDKSPYQYSVNPSRKKMQILGLFENNQIASLNSQVYADFSSRIPKGFGDKTQPIFLNADNSKVSEIFDILSFTGGKAVFQEQAIMSTSSGFTDIRNLEGIFASLKLNQKSTAYSGKKVYIVATRPEKILQGRLTGLGMEVLSQSGLTLNHIIEVNPDYILCDMSYNACNYEILNKLYDSGYKIISQGNDSNDLLYPIKSSEFVLHTSPFAGITIPYSQSHFISRGWITSGNSWGDSRERILSVHDNANIIAIDANSNTAEIVYLEETNKGRWIHFQPHTTIDSILFDRALAYLSR